MPPGYRAPRPRSAGALDSRPIGLPLPLALLLPSLALACPAGTWTAVTRADGLGSDHVNALSVGPDGRLWAATGDAHDTATLGGGVSVRSTDGSWTVHRAGQGSFRSDAAYAVVAGERVVVGTLGGASAFGDGWTRLPDAPVGGAALRDVSALHLDDAGTLWLAEQTRVLAFRGGAWRSWTVGSAGGLDAKPVVAFTPAPDGSLWTASLGSGLSRWDGERWTPAATDERLRYAHALAFAGGRTWVGTGIGLLVGGEAWTRRTSRDSALPGDTVTALRADGDAVWVGTEGGLAFARGEELTACPVDTGTVTSIAVDGSTVWVGTRGRGLFRFVPEAP